MKNNMKLVVILKIVLAVVCLGAILWNVYFQYAAAKGIIGQKYAAYDPHCPTGEYREVAVHALYPIGGEYIGGGNSLQGVAALYCAFEMEDGSFGVVKIHATAVGKSKKKDLTYRDVVDEEYKNWIMEGNWESANEMKEALVLRGKTVKMPEFYMDFVGLNDIIKDITLLDNEAEVPVKGALPSTVITIAVVLGIVDILTLPGDIVKMKRRKALEQSENTNVLDKEEKP